MARPPQIVVLAGVNGAGKSSIGGALLERRGGRYYDPDRATRRYVEAGLGSEEANIRAWQRGREQFEDAVLAGRDWAFETTLGGRTITGLLLEAARGSHQVRVWYAGLASAEQHIARVKARAARGGHDIPEARIRARWRSSRENLIRLVPLLAELMLFDNSVEAEPHTGALPRPRLLLHSRAGRIVHLVPVQSVPDWAKPVVMAQLRASGAS